MSPNELAVAQSAAAATWLGAIANLLVVCVTAALATRDGRERKARSRLDAARAQRKFRDGVAGLIGAADDALSFYPVNASYPGELVRIELDRRSGAGLLKIEQVFVLHLPIREQVLYEDYLGIFAELHGAISAARHANTMDAESLGMFHAKVGAWRAKISSVSAALA